MFKLLRSTCFYCHSLRAPRLQTMLLQRQLQLLDCGLLLAAKDLESALAGESSLARCCWHLCAVVIHRWPPSSLRSPEDDGEEAIDVDEIGATLEARLEARFQAALAQNNLRKPKSVMRFYEFIFTPW